MLRLNRSRFLGLFCLVIFIYFIVFTDSGSATTAEFRANTEAALARKRQREFDLPLRGRLSDEDLTKKTNEELQNILASQSRESVKTDEEGNPAGHYLREPVPVGPSTADLNKQGMTREEPGSYGRPKQDKTKVDVDEVGVAGRKSMQKPKYPKPDDKEKALKADAEDDETEDGSDPGKDFAREKLMEYLKNPIVIFSKSYCPHSKKAKHLLLDIYKIVPQPLVVELDHLTDHIPSTDTSHPKITLGRALQDLLAEITSRRTVPNIVVGGGHSIGGNDNIWEMHQSGHLVDEIKKFGGRKIVSVDVNESETNAPK